MESRDSRIVDIGDSDTDKIITATKKRDRLFLQVGLVFHLNMLFNISVVTFLVAVVVADLATFPKAVRVEEVFRLEDVRLEEVPPETALPT